MVVVTGMFSEQKRLIDRFLNRGAGWACDSQIAGDAKDFVLARESLAQRLPKRT